jgi:hypothetical protein
LRLSYVTIAKVLADWARVTHAGSAADSNAIKVNIMSDVTRIQVATDTLAQAEELLATATKAAELQRLAFLAANSHWEKTRRAGTPTSEKRAATAAWKRHEHAWKQAIQAQQQAEVSVAEEMARRLSRLLERPVSHCVRLPEGHYGGLAVTWFWPTEFEDADTQSAHAVGFALDEEGRYAVFGGDGGVFGQADLPQVLDMACVSLRQALAA